MFFFIHSLIHIIHTHHCIFIHLLLLISFLQRLLHSLTSLIPFILSFCIFTYSLRLPFPFITSFLFINLCASLKLLTRKQIYLSRYPRQDISSLLLCSPSFVLYCFFSTLLIWDISLRLTFIASSYSFSFPFSCFPLLLQITFHLSFLPCSLHLVFFFLVSIPPICHVFLSSILMSSMAVNCLLLLCYHPAIHSCNHVIVRPSATLRHHKSPSEPVTISASVLRALSLSLV